MPSQYWANTFKSDLKNPSAWGPVLNKRDWKQCTDIHYNILIKHCRQADKHIISRGPLKSTSANVFTKKTYVQLQEKLHINVYERIVATRMTLSSI